MTLPLTRIGYIGLGIMGGAMAVNLRKAGFELCVWNRSAGKSGPLVALGATEADSPAEMAQRGVQCICINVTDTADVEQVLFGEQGVSRTASPGLIVVDHSTISPAATQDFAARLAQQGVSLLDAPVSGGDVGAREGTLSIMVGGEADVFERVLPVLCAMGKAVHHVGAAGMGQMCKACNQVAVVNALQGVCEAIALARQSGLDVSKMMEVVAAGAGGSWQLANLGPRIAREDFAPGFMIDLVLKDLAIVLDAAARQGLSVEGTAAAKRRFEAVARDGGGKLGTQAMIRSIT